MSWTTTSTFCFAASLFNSFSPISSSLRSSYTRSSGTKYKQSSSFPSVNDNFFTISPLLLRPYSSSQSLITRAAEYKFPDPIPEFADAETKKFRDHLLKKLSKKEVYGESVEQVVGVCTEIFSTFLHSEYGGPGTLLVMPFIDMADTVNERGLPGGPQAARAAIKWAQNHVDKDWKQWTAADTG